MNKITKSFLMLLLLGAGAVSAQAQEEPDAWFNANHFRAKDYVDHVSPTEEEKDNWADICQNWEKTVPRWVTEGDGNGCIAITTNNWGGQNHHSQFWIKAAPLGLKEGATFHLHFRVKADKAQQIDGQAHYFFDYLIWNNPVGTIDVTDEWQVVDKDVTVAANQAGMTDVCFNLTREAIGSNTIYFDDIEVTNLDNKGEWAEKAPAWADKLGYAHMQTTWKEGETPSDANKSCASTPAKLVYSEENEDAYLEVVADPKTVNVWDNQFFIQIADANEKNKGKLNQNDEVKLTFWAMALLDKESTSTATEFDCGGGVHKSNDGKGYLDGFSGVKIKVGEWTKLTLDFNIKNPQITNYAFNLSNDSKPITYRFKDFVAEFTQGNEDWYLNNVIVAKDPAKDYQDGEAYEFPAAPYKVGKGEEGGYVEVKSKAEPANEWASQIFFQVPEKLVGKPVEISMKVKASEAIEIGAQRHADNSGAKYGDNYPAGNISFTTEWTPVKIQFDPVKGEGEGATTMTNYVLNLGKKGDVTYYFDDVAFAEHFDWGELVTAEVEGTLVDPNGSYDFTTAASFPYYTGMGSPDGASYGIDKDQKALRIENTNAELEAQNNFQLFILDWANVEQDRSYKVRLTMKATADGTADINLGTWSNGAYSVPFEFKKGYAQYVIDFPEYKGNSNGGKNDVHILWQGGLFVGTVFLEKVELFDCTPDYAAMDWADDNLVTNGDLEDEDMDAFVAKVVTKDDADPQILPVEAADLGKFAVEGEDGDGRNGIAITALKQSENGSADETQLWVRLSKVLPAGTLYQVEFDVMSTNITEIPTQIDMNPGTNVSKDGIAKGAAGSTPVKVAGAGEYLHYVNYCKAPEGGVGSIAFNLAGDKDYRYWFDNFSVKVLDDEEVAQAIEEANKDVDEALWDATLELNVAIDLGKKTETEGYTEESVKALTDAIADGKAELKNAEADAESLADAAADIILAIAGLEEPEEYLPAPDVTGLTEIAQAQEEPSDSGNPLADIEKIEVEGVPVTNYTTKGGICVVFKMLNVDVENADYITLQFAQPTPAGLSLAFWNGIKNIALPEGVDHYDYVFDDPKSESEIVDGIIPQVSIISINAGADIKLSVYGVYKHVVPVLEDCDLTKEMFFTWDAADATAQTTDQPNCAYVVGSSTDMPYGDGTVNEYNFADLSGYDHLAITATEGEPRLLFNRAPQDDHQGPLSVELPRDYGQNKYEAVVDNGDGSKTYVINLKEIVAKDGYAHLHAIKGANWHNTTVTEMKLFVGESEYTDVLTAIEEVADDAAVKDGKYFIDGQIVIVKNGVKYNAAGVAIQ